MTRLCPHCGLPLPERRLGVRLTPLKARIFDIIKRAGRDGIAGDDVRDIVWRYADKPVVGATLRVHITQINEQLDGTGFRITDGRHGYRLTRIIQ